MWTRSNKSANTIRIKERDRESDRQDYRVMSEGSGEKLLLFSLYDVYIPAQRCSSDESFVHPF